MNLMLIFFNEAGVQLCNPVFRIENHRKEMGHSSREYHPQESNLMSFLLLSFLAADWDPGRETQTVSVQQRGPSVSRQQCCCAWRPQHDRVIIADCCKGHADVIKALPSLWLRFLWERRT